MAGILDLIFGQQQPQQEPDLAQQILSSRFQPEQPTWNDVGNSALASVGSGQYVDPSSYGDARMTNAMKQMALIAQMQKAATPSVTSMGEMAFMKKAQGMPLTPQEEAAVTYLDSKQQNFTFNPVTGAMEKKPSLLERAGMLAGQQQSQTQPMQQESMPMQSSVAPSMSQQPSNIGMMPPPVGVSPKTRQRLEEKRVENQADREANYTKVQSSLSQFERQASTVSKTAAEALKLIDKPFSAATGWPSILTGGGQLPGDRRALDNALNTIKANIGFDKLQQMRENSPTGGALGQVTDFENRLLQAINGALDPLQEQQLRQNLASIKELYPLVLQEKQRAFKQDYGAFTPLGNNPQSPASSGGEMNELPPASQHDGRIIKQINPDGTTIRLKSNGQTWVQVNG